MLKGEFEWKTVVNYKEVCVIALDKQVHLYAVDTKAFYTDEEMALDGEMEQLRGERRRLSKTIDVLSDFYNEALSEKRLTKRLSELKFYGEAEKYIPDREKIGELKQALRAIAPQLNSRKEDMLKILDLFEGTRIFRDEYLRDKNVISIFESYLTRTLGIETSTLTMDLIVVKTCYFKILKDIVLNGFTLGGERYVYFTASAGQIRTKRSVFIRESQLEKYRDKLMCGLTVEKINAAGGVNTNKYLAYLALCNNATDLWTTFDITRSIVVDDMETIVPGVVDYIDDKTYEIERKEMGVPIAHTDGCGMVRLDMSRKNFMVRLPWVKGLLAAFPFDKFIREANKASPEVNHGLVTDIYGVAHDILVEDIQVIFTKSQFKMWKYYASWVEYQSYFMTLGCEASTCNMEEDEFENAKINYQMLQTLVDLSDKEIFEISRETRRRLETVSSNRNTMLRVFGATKSNPHRTGLQESLLLYPELLQDEYTRDTLREIKKSIEKEAKAGRLDVEGKYTFLIPDLYAFCQWLFLHEKTPSGLLEDGEVWCDLFPADETLDCLRSPHLYIEHAIRQNRYSSDYEAKRWFVTHGIYTSCHDHISKILQFDNDGDKSLVVSDQTIIRAAERNTKDVHPLFYQMQKAEAAPLAYDAIYNSMIWAYTSGKIGAISNDVSKIWNGDGPVNLDAIKLLCLDTNFSIDAAKTLYMPTRPDSVDSMIRSLTKGKVPHFFLYAKNKQPHQVAEKNGSCVNRIGDVIPSKRLEFNARTLGRLDYKMLLHDKLVPANEVSTLIIETYRHFVSSPDNKLRVGDDGRVKGYWRCQCLIDQLLAIHGDIHYIVDVLITELFCAHKSKRKVMFWICFGDIVAQNLRQNLGQNSCMCIHCGRRFYRESGRQVMCKECSEQQRRLSEKVRQRKLRKTIRNYENG